MQGCSLKQPNPSKQSFLLEPVRAGEARADSSPVQLRIRNLQVAAPFDGKGFVYRTSELGYKADFHTLEAMKKGDLPAIPVGPEAGKKPVVASLIDPAISPGIDKVIANLEIRPPQGERSAPSDIEIAAAKQLARDLGDAKIIEEPARDRIIDKLAEPSNR